MVSVQKSELVPYSAVQMFELDLDHEFASPVRAGLIGAVFSHVSHTSIDAFVRRAETV